VASAAKAGFQNNALTAALKCVHENFSRPSGTRVSLPLFPALKRRAMGRRASGAAFSCAWFHQTVRKRVPHAHAEALLHPKSSSTPTFSASCEAGPLPKPFKRRVVVCPRSMVKRPVRDWRYDGTFLGFWSPVHGRILTGKDGACRVTIVQRTTPAWGAGGRYAIASPVAHTASCQKANRGF
jgi:hypothetical protein